MKADSLWFKKSFPLTLALLKAQAVALTLLFLVDLAVLMSTQDAASALSRGQEYQRITILLGGAFYQIASGVFLFILLSWGIPKVHKFQSPKFLTQPFDTPYLSSFFAEYLRMVAQFLLFFILLIIPGLVRYCQLAFMPFIAIFDRNYRDDKEDALRLSKRLTRGRLPLIFGLLAAIVAGSTLFEYLPQMSKELHTPVARVLCALVEFLISVWAYCVMFLLFENLRTNLPAETEKK